MNKILATASVLALMAAAPAWAANPASAPNGSVAYHPTTTAANGKATAPTAQANSQAATNPDANAGTNQAANATAPGANGGQAADANAAPGTSADQSATAAANSGNEQAGKNATAPAANSNQAAGTMQENTANEQAGKNANANQAATTPSTQNEQATKANGAAAASEQGSAAANPETQTNATAESTGGATAANKSVSSMDRNFVKEATSASLAEIAEGKLAIQRASDLAVRQFGRWMVTDHTNMLTMLGAPAKDAGIAIPTQPSTQDQNQLNRLQSLNGVEFEQQYVAEQVAAHQKALQLFQQEAQSGQDNSLRLVAKLGEPMLKQHLAAAQELQSAMPEIVAATQNLNATQNRQK